MKQILSEADTTALDRRIAEAEKQTKAQIVLATVRRSDSYAEIPWKAFAFGSSVAGFAVVLLHFMVPRWIEGPVILYSVTAILATGALFVLLTILSQGFARLFLSEIRRDTETMQYAESLFLSRGLYETDGKRGVLLLISHFERKVVILPDKGIQGKLSITVMGSIISKMTHYLRHDEVRLAMETGLDELIRALSPAESAWTDKNELSNEILED